MTDSQTVLFSERTYAALWLVAAALVAVSGAGEVLDWWGTGNWIWWVTISLLVGLAVAQTYEMRRSMFP